VKKDKNRRALKESDGLPGDPIDDSGPMIEKENSEMGNLEIDNPVKEESDHSTEKDDHSIGDILQEDLKARVIGRTDPSTGDHTIQGEKMADLRVVEKVVIDRLLEDPISEEMMGKKDKKDDLQDQDSLKLVMKMRGAQTDRWKAV